MVPFSTNIHLSLCPEKWGKTSPGTCNWSDQNSGLFIWVKSFDPISKLMTIDIFRDEAYNPNNGMPLSTILHMTPPSRPMGINISATACNNNMMYPIITWTHNTEPDMLQGNGNNYKRYKIFRAYEKIDGIPGNYIEIADIVVNKDLAPSYTDYSCYAGCINGFLSNNYRLRYRVEAVDNTGWASVPSDFVSSAAIELHTGLEGYSIKSNEPPKSYALSQNYPNPFNPVTRINYALPKDGFVTLKVYDIIGREVANIISEFKTAGNYSIDFDASKLSSGIYYYKLQSDLFSSVKKMVLMK